MMSTLRRNKSMLLKFVVACLALSTSSAGGNFPRFDRASQHARLNSLVGSRALEGVTEVKEGEFPWHVSIESIFNSDYYRPFCSGVIVSADYVLTSATCQYWDTPQERKVYAGSLNRLSPKSVHNVVKAVIHPAFDDYTVENDIALWKVDPPFKWSNSIQAAQIPQQGVSLAAGKSMNAVGLGNVDTDNPDYYSNDLHKIIGNIVSKNDCNLKYAQFGGIYNSHICAGTFYDRYSPVFNGSPLFDANFGRVVYGILAGGRFCPEGCPVVYTKVSHYSTWITQTINATSSCKARYN